MVHQGRSFASYLRRVGMGLLAVLLLAVGILWARDVAIDRSYKLAVTGPTPLYSSSPIERSSSNPVVAVLQPGEPVRVLRMRYGKDFQTFQVETKNGPTGWLVYGNSIKVLSHG